LDEYRRAVRAVASAAPAASVRARAERRKARNRTVAALAAAAAVVAVMDSGMILAGHANRQGPPPEMGQEMATSAPAAPMPCRSAALFPRLGRPTISGTEATGFIELINIGAPCTVSGHIGLQLRTYGGTPITTSVQRQRDTSATITITTGRSAIAAIAWTWSDGSSTRCQTASEVAVTVPGDSSAVTAPWVSGDAGSVCGGVVKLYPLTP
jgi:hypothetical protein